MNIIIYSWILFFLFLFKEKGVINRVAKSKFYQFWTTRFFQIFRQICAVFCHLFFISLNMQIRKHLKKVIFQTCKWSKLCQYYVRVWRIPFFDQILIPIIIRFSEINKHQISNTIRYWQNPNTEYYSVSRKSKYRIQSVLFDLTIWIPNTKYQKVYNILENLKLKNIYLFYTSHFLLKICETNRTGIWSNYSNTRILIGVPKNLNTKSYSV